MPKVKVQIEIELAPADVNQDTWVRLLSLLKDWVDDLRSLVRLSGNSQ